MIHRAAFLLLSAAAILLTSCSTAYKPQPLPFKTPSAYDNATLVASTWIGAQAYVDHDTAAEAFGFNIRDAGMLPVQVVLDNQGNGTLEIVPGQTFLEDQSGQLWPILTDTLAYQRATRYAQTKQVFKKGAYSGFLGATAGGLIGAAIGIVSGDNVALAAGKGAAIGGAAGATMGGAAGLGSNEARSAVTNDLREKSLQNKVVPPGNLAYGIIFFPGEATSARQLRLQLREKESGAVHTVFLKLD